MCIRDSVLSAQHDAPCVRRFKAGNDAQRGGLSAARRAEQRYKLAVLHAQAHAVQHARVAKMFFNMFQFQNGVAHGFSLSLIHI